MEQEESGTEVYDLKPGDRVLIRRKGAHQQGKLQTPWEEVPGVVLQQPIPGVPVYDVQKENTQDRPRRLHRRLLKPIRNYVEVPESLSREPEEQVSKPPVAVPAENQWWLLPVPSLLPPNLQGEITDTDNARQPNDCPARIPTPAVEPSDPLSTEMPESEDVPLPAPEEEPEPQPLRCSQRHNFGKPPERFAQEDFVWSVNLPGIASSSGVECSGMPFCPDSGAGPFNSTPHNPLSSWTRPGDIKVSSTQLPVLREILPDGTAVTGQVSCSQVLGPPLLSLVCGPPAVSTRARSIFPSPSHWRGLCYSPLVEAVHEVSWPYLQPPEPPDQSK